MFKKISFGCWTFCIAIMFSNVISFGQGINQNKIASKMKIEIWSDVVCPFCYIGKRKLENAIKKLDTKSVIEIEWKSFQLNPELVTDTTKNLYQSLSENKGITVENAKEMADYAAKFAKNVGLTLASL